VAAAPDIVVDEVTRRWGAREAVAGVSLRLAPGARVALLGPSGSGKTTLLRLIAGSLRPTSGHVRVDGVAIDELGARGLRAHRHRLGLVDQGALLVPQLTVHDNVIAGLVPRWSWPRVLVSALWPLERRRVRALLEAVGLSDRQWDGAGALSGGQRQRVAIARALAGDPGLILADEPTAALDPSTAAETLSLLVDAATRRGATVVVSTHRALEALRHVDRVIGLRDGKVALDAASVDVDERALDRLYEGSRERP
jgi:phosphonate transport system ATP-binding protein